MTATVADLKIAIGVDGVDKAAGQLRGMGGEVDRTGKHFGLLKGLAAGFAGGIAATLVPSVGGLASKFIMANANMETWRNGLNIAVGDVGKAGKIFADLKKFAAATPFEFPELIQAAQNLEALGISSQQYLRTLGDTAAATNKTLDQTTQAFADASVGEFERLKEFGIQAKTVGDQVTFSYMQNGKQITKTVQKGNQAVIQSTLAGIWNDKYKGAMETQSKTFSGQWSTLKDNINMAMMQASGGVFNVLKGMIAFANDIFARGWKAAFTDAFGPGVTGAISTFVGAIGSVVGTISGFVSGMKDAFGEGAKVSDLVLKFPQPLRGMAKGFLSIADAIGDLVSRFQSGGFGAMLDIVPQKLGQMFDGLKQIGSQVLDIAIDTVVNIGGWLKDHAGDIWGGIKSLVGWTTDNFSDAISATIDGALTLGGDLADAMGDIWGWVKRKLGFSGASGDGTGGPDTDRRFTFDSVIDGALTLGGDLADAAANFGGWLRSQLRVSEAGAVDIGVVKIQAKPELTIVGFKVNLGNSVAALSAGLVSSVMGAFHDAGRQVGDSIGSTLADVGPKLVRSAADTIRNASWGDVPLAIGAGLVAAANLTNLPVAAIAALSGAFSVGLIGGLVDGLTKEWSARAYQWLNDLPAHIANAVPDLSYTLLQNGADTITGLFTGATQKWTDVETWLMTRGPAAFDAIGDLIAILDTRGRDLIQGAWTGASARWTDVKVWLGGRGQAAFDAVGDLTATLVSSGGDLITGLWDGAGDAWDSLFDWFQGMGNRVVNAIGDLGNYLYQSGRDVIGGFAQGIWDSIPGLQDAVNAAMGPINWLREHGASPWPMMIESGQDVIAGFAIGIAKETKRSLQGAVSDAFDVASGLANARVGAGGSGAATYGALSGLRSGQLGGTGNISIDNRSNVVHLTVNVDGSGSAQEITDTVFRTLQREAGLLWAG